MENVINGIGQPEMAAENFSVKKSESQILDKETTANQTETAYYAVSSQGDTLSISETGKAANSSERVVLQSKSNADGTVLKEENIIYDEESDSSNSTVNLSIYTENELRQMYLNGDITKAEYDEELSSRGIE